MAFGDPSCDPMGFGDTTRSEVWANSQVVATRLRPLWGAISRVLALQWVEATGCVGPMRGDAVGNNSDPRGWQRTHGLWRLQGCWPPLLVAVPMVAAIHSFMQPSIHSCIHLSMLCHPQAFAARGRPHSCGVTTPRTEDVATLFFHRDGFVHEELAKHSCGKRRHNVTSTTPLHASRHRRRDLGSRLADGRQGQPGGDDEHKGTTGKGSDGKGSGGKGSGGRGFDGKGSNSKGSSVNPTRRVRTMAKRVGWNRSITP